MKPIETSDKKIKREPYETPTIRSEKTFEVFALACDKPSQWPGFPCDPNPPVPPNKS